MLYLIEIEAKKKSSKKDLTATMIRSILRCDVFRVVQDRERHLTPSTSEGAFFSIAALVLIVALSLIELMSFFSPNIRSSMFVDHHMVKTEKVHFNISFPQLPCGVIDVSVFDPNTGLTVPELAKTIVYARERILSDSWHTVLGLYEGGRAVGVEKEGCRVSGVFAIDKVPGFVYIAADGSIPPHAMPPSDHYIHSLWIGDQPLDQKHDHISPELSNALKGVSHLKEDPPHTMYQYYLQIVPTYMADTYGRTTKVGYQYTATFSKAPGPDHLQPGVYIRYSHASIGVEYRLEYQTWSHFFVHVSAIIGGIYTVMGIAASLYDQGKCTVGKLLNR